MSDLHVVFQVAGAHYVVPANEVVQLESFQGATPVPGAPDFVEGLVQIRGAVVPVINLRRRFGKEPIEPGLDSRVIVVRGGSRTVGLLADRSREVVQLAPDELRPPPDIIQQQASGFVRAVAGRGDRLLMLIDFDKVVGEGEIHGE